MSVPGIGSTIAISLLTEIDDIGRFSNQCQLASFIGFVPMMPSSGDKDIQVYPDNLNVIEELVPQVKQCLCRNLIT